MYQYQTDLWEAINRYVEACGGDPVKMVYGNTCRMDAVCDVEDVVEKILNSKQANTANGQIQPA